MDTQMGNVMGGFHEVSNVEYSSYKMAVTKCKLIFKVALDKRAGFLTCGMLLWLQKTCWENTA
jgi:hypothetical protein